MYPCRMLRALATAAAALLACGRGAPASSTAAPDAGLAGALRSLAAITATCASATGEVQVRRGAGGEWLAASTGAVLRPGDSVRTGSASSARVEFVAGGGLELDENAEVTIDASPPPAAGGASRPAGSRVSVEKGVVRGSMPAGDSLPMVLRTADGGDVRLAGKAGEVKVRLARDGRGTEVAVISGEANVAGSAGERTLRSGQAADATSAGAAEAVPLPAFPASVEPGIDARFRFSDQLAIRLAWQPAENAAGYRVQVARDLSFQRVERVIDVKLPETTLSPRVGGVYAWRVASRDASGRLGEYGFARRIYCEREQPRDLLVGPPDGMVVRFSKAPSSIQFTWQSSASAAAYRLLVAPDPDLLAHAVIDLDTAGQRLEVAALKPGTYYWGVYVKDPDASVPIFVKPRALVVQQPASHKAKPTRALTRRKR